MQHDLHFTQITSGLSSSHIPGHNLDCQQSAMLCFTVSSTRWSRVDGCGAQQEMLSELFTPVETPEAPNRGFFKGLFGGGAQSLDREDLCECNTAFVLFLLLIFSNSLFFLTLISA